MIGLDTNVLLGLYTEDDAAQKTTAERHLAAWVAKGSKPFVSLVVLVEAVWVLSKVFHYSRHQIISFLELILFSEAFIVEETDIAHRAFEIFRDNHFDFSDLIIALTNRAHGCTTTLTFDRKAARLPDFELVT